MLRIAQPTASLLLPVGMLGIALIACDSAGAPPSVGQPPTPSPPPTTTTERAPEPERPREETHRSADRDLVRARVKLVVLGSFPDELAEAVAGRLERELDVEVERPDDVALPRFAYYEPRRRYRAERLLDFLNQRLAGEPPTTRVLGLTSVDISTTKGRHRDWGIFGLGEIGGRSCVISTHRLRRRARDQDHVTFRVATTAVHEVGHTLGLEHCTEPRCLMRDAEGSIETVDSSTGELGPGCVRRLDRYAPRAVGRSR